MAVPIKRRSEADACAQFASEFSSKSTRQERKAMGKQARERAPLKAHSRLNLSTTGRNIIDVLEKSNVGRIKELIPIRYGRMISSPFTFYRGSAALMAMDLAHTAASGFNVQVCGDCHIQNFGVYASPERKIVVDINDFDETLPAPWEWDVKRLAASLVLAARSNGFSKETGEDAAFRMVESYREHIAELSEMTHLEVWYSHVALDELKAISKSETRLRQEKQLQDALKKSSPEVLLESFVTTAGGKLRFKEIPPLLCHMEGVSAGEQEQQAFEEYRMTLRDHRRVLLNRYEMVDIARKVVGIGSVGTMCGVILLASSDNDILVLQLKEARRSVLEPYTQKSRFEHQGERVVDGQKIMQASSDSFLGWTTGRRPPHRHFFVRQLRDVKIGTNTALWSKDDFRTMPGISGKILARAHSRSGDACIMRGYLGKDDEFETAVTRYAVDYAQQTEKDHRAFQKACRSGELTAESDV